MTNSNPPEQSTQQPPQAQANGPQRQAAGTRPPLSQALQQQIAQAMQPVLGDLQQQIAQAVRQQMERGLQPRQDGQPQEEQQAAKPSPLRIALQKTRAMVQQVIEWLMRMLRAVRDWWNELVQSLIRAAVKAAIKAAVKPMLRQAVKSIQPILQEG